MYFDGQLIFKGELARATGGVGGAEGSEVSEPLHSTMQLPLTLQVSSLSYKFSHTLFHTQHTPFPDLCKFLHSYLSYAPLTLSLTTLSLFFPLADNFVHNGC